MLHGARAARFLHTSRGLQLSAKPVTRSLPCTSSSRRQFMREQRGLSMPEDRIARLSERFKTHGVGRKRSADRARERKSFYLDGEVVERLDRTYKEINHALFPRALNKSEFLEAVLEYGLDHIADVKA